MSVDKLLAVAVILAAFVILLAIVAVETQRGLINKYDDTISEYMMCIEYNPDCECSNIILSEYGEEK